MAILKVNANMNASAWLRDTRRHHLADVGGHWPHAANGRGSVPVPRNSPDSTPNADSFDGHRA